MSDERCFDDLDSLLRWTLMDLVPEQEPPGRAWRAIRAQIRVARELRRQRPGEVHRPRASSVRVYSIPRPYAEEKEALLHLWALVKI